VKVDKTNIGSEKVEIEVEDLKKGSEESEKGFEKILLEDNLKPMTEKS